MLLFWPALVVMVVSCSHGTGSENLGRESWPISDHYNGEVFFNPEIPEQAQQRDENRPRRSRLGWIWRFIFGTGWPDWPEPDAGETGKPPAERIQAGSIVITPVGHAAFLIQMDGLNILTDPIWSERCSPVSWAGPRRHQAPGLGFDDLPSIDVILISHNHYDHLDLPTLKRLSSRGVRRAVTTLGNRGLIVDAGLSDVEELDWGQSVRLSRNVLVEVVPARHFSARSLSDRNETLWGGFVISGPSGNVYFAGDTGYGPHFKEIRKKFAPIKAAILPIAPFSPWSPEDRYPPRRSEVHLRPSEAVQAHLDLQAEVSIASHYQVFQLGPDGFHDSTAELEKSLAELDLEPDVFMTPPPGRAVSLGVEVTSAERPQSQRKE